MRNPRQFETMETFPVIETDRIRLRKPAAKDLSRIIEYANNPKIAAMTLNVPHPYQEKDAIYWINMANERFEEGTGFIFAVAKLSSDDFIGAIGLKINKRFNRAELGFWIGESFWDKGFISEATKEILRFGFEEAGLNKIYAHHMLENLASGKVMKKNGMIKEGELIDHIKKGDEYKSVALYRLTKNEYLTRLKEE